MQKMSTARVAEVFPGVAAQFVTSVQRELQRLGYGSYAALSQVTLSLGPNQRLELLQGEQYVSYDHVIGSFIASGGSVNAQPPIPFCPHLGCRLNSEYTFQCDHYRAEVKLASDEQYGGRRPLVIQPFVDAGRKWSAGDEVYATLFKDNTISFEGIRFVLDLVATRRGISVRQTADGQTALLDSVGNLPFFDLELQLLVSRAAPSSRSLAINPSRGFMTYMTCGIPGCDFEGTASTRPSNSHYCQLHGGLTRGRGPLFVERVVVELRHELLAHVTGHWNKGLYTNEDWILALTHLHACGDAGFRSAGSSVPGRLLLVSKIGLVSDCKASNLHFYAHCLWLGCSSRPADKVNLHAQFKELSRHFPTGPPLTNLQSLSRLVMCSVHYPQAASKELVSRLCQGLEDYKYGSAGQVKCNYGPSIIYPVRNVPVVRDPFTQSVMTEGGILDGVRQPKTHSYPPPRRPSAAGEQQSKQPSIQGTSTNPPESTMGNPFKSLVSFFLKIRDHCDPKNWQLAK